MSSTDKDNSNWTLLFICWLLASVGTLGSLFFSEILDYPPCVLCWYQRICLFPLVVILFTGLFPYNASVVKFSLPLAIIGWTVAAYHNLLYIGVIPKSIQPCDKALSCTDVQLELFSFITIPFLSFIAFSTLIFLLIILHRRSNK